MVSKATIASIILAMFVVYIISPWFFEKRLLFNELLSGIGFLLLAYHRFRIEKSPVTISVLLLIGWGLIHALLSIFVMDSVYYLLRNSVIIYSMFGFFVGYYCLKYLPDFIRRSRIALQVYILFFLFFPVSKLFFERFGMAVLFQTMFKRVSKLTLPLLILINLVYGIQYKSATGILVAAFFVILLLVTSFRVFVGLFLAGSIVFIAFFASVEPNLEIIRQHYSPYSDDAIHEVMNSHPLLSIDGNSTWRLVLWKQVLIDQFPRNLLGIGLGTPMFKYFPVEDVTKIKSLPYVLGAHNSFVYLFGRLGLIYVLLNLAIYWNLLKEYFTYKSYYYQTKEVLLFWSFFAFSIIALVNPTLESPIYAVGYWITLGFTSKAIVNRRYFTQQNKFVENSFHT